MVLFFTAPTIPEGHVVKGLLESQGILVMLKGEGEGPYRMGPVDLWIPEESVAQARTILEHAGRAEDEGNPQDN